MKVLLIFGYGAFVMAIIQLIKECGVEIIVFRVRVCVLLNHSSIRLL